MAAVAGSGGSSGKRRRKHKGGGDHRPYGGGHAAPSGNVKVRVKPHQRAINRGARKATHTQKFQHAAAHPSASDYAKKYAKPVASAQNERAQSQAAHSPIAGTLAATTKPATGIRPGAEEKAQKALAADRPSFTPSALQHTVEDLTGLRVSPENVQLLTSSPSDTPSTYADKLKTLGTAAALVGGPEAAGAGLRAAGKLLRVVRGGEKGAAEAERAAEIARARPKVKAKGVKARARRAQARASQKVEKPLEAPKMRVKRIGTKSTARSKTARSYAAAATVAPATGGHPTPGKRLSALVKGHEQAILHHPIPTLETTLRTAEGVPAATAAIPAAVYESVKHGTTKPIEGLAQQQVDYLKEVGKLYSGDPKTVERTIENKVGLVPAISVGLGGTAVGRAVSRGAKAVIPKEVASEAVKVDARTRKLAEQAATAPSRSAREEARLELESANRESLRSRHAGRKAESERAGVREHRRASHEHREKKIVVRPASKAAHKRVGEFTQLDLAQYLGRHAYGPETHDLLGKIRRDREALKEPSRAIHPDSPHTAAVIDTILAHPEVLQEKSLWRTIEAFRKAQHERGIERHEIATGQAQTTPLPRDERSRLLTFMRAEGIPTQEERIAPELVGKTKVQVRAGRDADKHLRATAKRMQRKAANNRKLAAELRKAGNHKKATALEQRAAKSEATAQERLAVTDRFRRAERLDNIAAKIEAGQTPTERELADAAGVGDSAKSLRAEAEKLREAHAASQRQRADEAMAAAQAKIESDKFKQPVYFKQTDVARSTRPAGYEVRVPRSGGTKERFKSGSLEEQGRIDESGQTLMENFQRGRVDLAHLRTAIEAVKENSFRIHDSRFLTDDAYTAYKREGKIPQGYSLVRVQEFSGVIQRNAELRHEYELARQRAAAAGGSRTIYMLWKDSRKQQYEAQLRNLGKPLRVVRGATRLQAGLMLGTSPTWEVFQIPATPFAVAARNWSPARYARSTHMMVDIYRNASDRVRAELEANWGANSGNLFDIGEVHTDIRPDTIRGMRDSAKLVFRSPLGRFVHRSLGNLQRGGPLIALNRAYEAKVRNFAALMEMDRLSGLTHKGTPTISARVVKFIDRTGRLTNTIYPLMDKLAGMKPHERAEYLINHADDMKLVNRGLNDALGEWASLTDRERAMTSVFAFYPFLRFSLRWYFYTFPKNNPLKAAIAINLAQSNDVELVKLFGGNPDLLQSFGDIITYGPDGKPHLAMNLGRSGPGGNSVIEALSSGKLDLSAVLRPTQPLIGGSALALAGKTAFGDAPSGTSTADLLARNVLSLSPVTRPLAKTVGPEQSDISKLFAAIQGNPNPLIPQVTVDLNRQAEVVKLQKLLTTAYQEPLDLTSLSQVPKFFPKAQFKKGRRIVQQKDAAWKQIDAMMVRYGIQSPASQKRKKNRASQTYKSYSKQYGIFGTEPNQKKKSSSGSYGSGGSYGGGGGYGSSSGY